MIARIFADFNRITRDEFGERVTLGKEGSWQLEPYRLLDWLMPGSTVQLSDGELEVVAVLEFDPNANFWYARPDWTTRRDLNSPADGMEQLRLFPADKRLIIIRHELDVLIHAVQGGVELLNSRVAETAPTGELATIARIAEGLTDSTGTLREVFDALTDPFDKDYLHP